MAKQVNVMEIRRILTIEWLRVSNWGNSQYKVTAETEHGNIREFVTALNGRIGYTVKNFEYKEHMRFYWSIKYNKPTLHDIELISER